MVGRWEGRVKKVTETRKKEERKERERRSAHRKCCNIWDPFKLLRLLSKYIYMALSLQNKIRKYDFGSCIARGRFLLL